ncbi:unnamed protein product [Haemonchus placei]|uniref:Doublecortin domain-containing protein n=1 Tax=Haemonchus placei TaxID=6290 RepID=A0A158QQK3_HAEPC|nr:unnamed protein product [Haemonchus placei]
MNGQQISKPVLPGQGVNHLSLTEPRTRVLRSRVITVLPQTQLPRRNRKCGNGKNSILSKRKAQEELLSEEPAKCKLEKRVNAKPSSLTPIAAKRSHLTKKTKKRHNAKRLKAKSSSQRKNNSQKRSSEKMKKGSAAMNQRSVRLTIHCNGKQVVVHTARMQHQMWLPDKNVISDRVESYGRVGDIPIYFTEDNQAIYEYNNLHSGYWAKEVVPMAYLTKGQIKELEKLGFELTSVPIPENPTPIQKLAVRDVTAGYAPSKRRKW